MFRSLCPLHTVISGTEGLIVVHSPPLQWAVAVHISIKFRYTFSRADILMRSSHQGLFTGVSSIDASSIARLRSMWVLMRFPEAAITVCE